MAGKPRSAWNGALSIGLVNVPVKLASLVSSEHISFHRVAEVNGQVEKLRQVQLNSKKKEVPSDQWLQGYPHGDGYILVTKEDIASCEAVQNKTIEIDRFVLERNIDPIYFDKPYIVFPDKGGDKGYALMVKAMKKQKVAAVGKFVMRSKQYIVTIRPRGNMLLAHLMFYPSEVADTDPWDQGLGAISVTNQEIATAAKLIDALTADFDPSLYRNEVAEAMREMLDSKMKKKGVKMRVQEPVVATDDILTAIEASLEQSGKKRPAAKKTGNGQAAAAATKAKAARSRKVTK